MVSEGFGDKEPNEKLSSIFNKVRDNFRNKVNEINETKLLLDFMVKTKNVLV